MSTTLKASLEAKLKNSKDLIILLGDFSQYMPTSEDIKIESYSNFISSVESEMTNFKNVTGNYKTWKKKTNDLFITLTATARKIRSEIGENIGIESHEYKSVNEFVRLITGENISRHAEKIKNQLKNKKEGEPEPEIYSVSSLDRKTRFGNFRKLLGILRSFESYNPADEKLKIESLETFEKEISDMLETLTQKEAEYVNQRSRIIHYFNDKGGLRDRAKRARMHVRRKYGSASPEYQSVVNKRY